MVYLATSFVEPLVIAEICSGAVEAFFLKR
jgi:hypothetical protein